MTVLEPLTGNAFNLTMQITDLRRRLADSQKTVLELEAEREQRQRDYDKKLLLAKSKIENVQVSRIDFKMEIQVKGHPF